VIALLALVGCAKPVDPLLAQREALTLALEAPLPEGWAPQAVMVVRQSAVDDVVAEALGRAMAAVAAPVKQSFFGLTASMTPTVRVTAARVTAGEGCESCLSVTLDLAGAAELALENRTGRKEQRVDWTGQASGTVAVALDEERRQVVASIAEPERWRASVDFAQVPGGWNSAISSALSAGLQTQVSRPALPALPLMRLQEDPRARLRGVRLRTAPEGLAVDFAFALGTAGTVDDLSGALPDGADWAALVPEATALGVLQAAALAQPFDPTRPATPELVGLSLDGEFVLDVNAWPTRGRAAPRAVAVLGEVVLVEGDVVVDAKGALLEDTALPDWVTLIYGDRLLEELTDAVSLTVPGVRTQSLGGVALSGRTTAVSTADGVMRLSGDFSLE